MNAIRRYITAAIFLIAAIGAATAQERGLFATRVAIDGQSVSVSLPGDAPGHQVKLILDSIEELDALTVRLKAARLDMVAAKMCRLPQ